LFVEHPHREDRDLEDENCGLFESALPVIADMLPKNDDLLLAREMGSQIGKGFFGFLGKLGERASELG